MHNYWSKRRAAEAAGGSKPSTFKARPDLPVYAIDWSTYETAYGSAESVPGLLDRLSGTDLDTAMDASHDLWCGLCHQHAYVSSAALPALPFLLSALDQAGEYLQIEILDILAGFAVCTSRVGSNSEWETALREALIAQLPKFERLAGSGDEEIASISAAIVESLQR